MAEEVKENKKLVVDRIATSVKLDRAEVEKVVDTFVLEAAMPKVFKAGGEVAWFDNNCNNNCKEELAMAALRAREIR
jgi:hypothetical protein